MLNNRNKLYLLIFTACLAGYIWYFYNTSEKFTKTAELDVCIIKHTTNIPCPSCGSTRSVITLLQGNFIEAFLINPLGLIVAAIMIFAPLWIIADITVGKSTLFNFYKKTEVFLKQPKYSIPLIFFTVINWIWNITKGL
jgi:hypothetical protein